MRQLSQRASEFNVNPNKPSQAFTQRAVEERRCITITLLNACEQVATVLGQRNTPSLPVSSAVLRGIVSR